MHRIKIHSKPRIEIRSNCLYRPPFRWLCITDLQRLIEGLGRALPGILTDKNVKYHLDPGTTASNVLVTHHRLRGRGVDTPALQILVLLGSDEPTAVERGTVRHNFARDLSDWLKSHSYEVPEGGIAVEIFWGPSHGFFMSGGHIKEW